MKKGLGVLALTTVSTLALAVPVFAQETPEPTAAVEEDETARLDTITVSARQRDETLLDVPFAVSASDRATLERDQVVDLNDLSRTTPALEVNQTFGGEQNGGGRVRGLGTGVFNRSVSPSVAYILDGAPQGNLNFRTLFDLQQVEVLRGPQGTLFGQGASAGVINVRTVDPVFDEFSGDVTVDYASNGDLGSESGRTIIDAGVNIPIADNMALRVAGQVRSEEGVQFNAFDNDFNEQDQWGVRAKLLWEVSPDFTLNTKVEFTDQKIDGRDFFGFDGVNPPAGAPASGGTAANLGLCGVNVADLEDYASVTCQDIYRQDDNTFTFTNTAEFNIGGVPVTSVTSYRTLDVDIIATNFSSQAFGIAARDENLKEESEQFTQELRANFVVGDLDLIVGGFYSQYEFEVSPLIDGPFGVPIQGQRIGFSLCTSDGVTPFGPPIPCIPGNFPTFVKNQTENSTVAIFADATYSLSDQWDVFGGLRLSDYDNDSFVGEGNNPTVGTDLNTGETNVSGRIGARYKPDANTTVYGSIAQGYKPSAVAVTDLTDDPTTPELENVSQLDEEKALAFELGIKRDVGSATLEANVFHTTVEDFQAQTNEFIGSAALVSVPRNIEEIVSYGFELAAYGELGDSLTYSAGYIYNNATYPDGFLGDGENFRLGALPADLGGEQVQYAPEHKLTLTGEYEHDFNNTLQGFVNTNIVYKSEVLLAQFAPDLTTYEGHTTIGGAIGVRSSDGVWSASLFGRNLTQEREPIGYLGQPFPDGAVRSWPQVGITTRLVGVRLDANF